MSWTPHINKIHANMCRSISILYNVSSLVPKWLKLQLYYALVHSHLQYCLLIWGTTTQTNLDRLLILQKRAVRCIENLKRNDHTAPSFSKLNILRIDQLLQLRLAMHTHRQLLHDPQVLSLSSLSDHSQYHLRQNRLRTPMFRTKYGTQTLAYLIPHFLNNNREIANMIRDNSSTYSLRKKVKDYLMFSS